MTCWVSTAPKWQRDTKPAFVWRTLIVRKVIMAVLFISNLLLGELHKRNPGLLQMLFKVWFNDFILNVYRNPEEVCLCKLWGAGHFSRLLRHLQARYWLSVDRHHRPEARRLHLPGRGFNLISSQEIFLKVLFHVSLLTGLSWRDILVKKKQKTSFISCSINCRSVVLTRDNPRVIIKMDVP